MSFVPPILNLTATTPSLGARAWVDGDELIVSFATTGGRGPADTVLLLPVQSSAPSKSTAATTSLHSGFRAEWAAQGDALWQRDPFRLWRRTPESVSGPQTLRLPLAQGPAAWAGHDEMLVVLLYRQFADVGEDDPGPSPQAPAVATVARPLIGALDEIAQVVDMCTRPRLRRGLLRLAPAAATEPTHGYGSAASPIDTCFALASCQYPADLLDASPRNPAFSAGPADASLARLSACLDSGPPEQRPTLLVLAGDQVYLDDMAGLFEARANDDRYHSRYQFLLESRGMQLVSARLPIACMLDDHEIVDNWEPMPSGGPGAAAALEWDGARSDGVGAFIDYQRMAGPPLAYPADRCSLWCSFEHGGLPFFMADTRTQRERRTARRLATARLMHEQQFSELKQWLLEHRAGPCFVVTPSILLPRQRLTADDADDEAGALHSDAWDGYPASLHELLAFLCDEQLSSVVFLSGDEHVSCAVRASVTRRDGLSVSLHSVHSSALYAPYPFANGTPQQFKSPDCFGFEVRRRAYQCQVEAATWAPGDGFARLRVCPSPSRPGRCQLWVQFDRAGVQASVQVAPFELG